MVRGKLALAAGALTLARGRRKDPLIPASVTTDGLVLPVRRHVTQREMAGTWGKADGRSLFLRAVDHQKYAQFQSSFHHSSEAGSS